jgi:hypothetical protein
VNNEIWQFNGAAWRQLPNRGTVPAGRYGPIYGMAPGSSSFMYGHGFAKRRYSDVLAYDMEEESWYTLFQGTNPYNPNAPHARCLTAGTTVSQTRLFMYGGCMTVRPMLFLSICLFCGSS